MKTMAIRLDDELSAQLHVLAQLDGISVADEIRHGIELLLEQKRSQAGLAERADQVLSEIDQDATARKQAIQALFGRGEGEERPTPPGRTRASRRSRTETAPETE